MIDQVFLIREAIFIDEERSEKKDEKHHRNSDTIKYRKGTIDIFQIILYTVVSNRHFLSIRYGNP